MKITVNIKPEMFRPPEGATHYHAFYAGFSNLMKVKIVWYKVTWARTRNTLVDVEVYDEKTDRWDFFLPPEGTEEHLRTLTEVPEP